MALWINTNIVFEREMNLLHVTLERVSDAKKIIHYCQLHFWYVRVSTTMVANIISKRPTFSKLKH